MPEAMIIGYLASSYPRAVDTAVRNEVFELRTRKHTVHTFSIRRPDASQLVSELHVREHVNTVYILSDHVLNTPVSVLKLLFRSPRRFWRAFMLARRTRAPGLKRLLWQIAYFLEAAFLADQMLQKGIQHLHNHIGENSATVAMLASELSGIPYSMTIHGPYIFRAPKGWALGEKITRSAFTVCITEFTKSQCMIYVPHTHWDRLHVIRCGPEPALLESKPPPPNDSRRLVWVGRICEEKAVPVLLEAAQRLIARGVDLELVMVGDGPMRPNIEAQIRAQGLAERVSITGWMKNEGVREQIAAARAMVLPSFAEGLPAVLMEALALGRPAISTYVAGIPELIEPGVNGWLVPAGSVDHLEHAMLEALQTPLDKLEQMGQAGRQAVLRKHDTTTEVGKLEKLMAQCTDNASATPDEQGA